MAISSPWIHFLVVLIVFLISMSLSRAEIRFSEIRSYGRSIIPFNEFGFTNTGRLELNVSCISFSNSNPDLSQLGFFLSARDSWLHVVQEIQSGDITCALQSKFVRKVYTFDQLDPNSANTNTFSLSTFHEEHEPSQFTLVSPTASAMLDAIHAVVNMNSMDGWI